MERAPHAGGAARLGFGRGLLFHNGVPRKKAEIPAILVECGFLSNSEETVLLNSQAHQNRLAVTILASALAHLNQP